MLQQLMDWGFTRQSWRGQRGEYWVLAQAMLMLMYFAVPAYNPWHDRLNNLSIGYLHYGCWAIALPLSLLALYLLAKGIMDLGTSLTPLPYPRDDSKLVQTGAYGIVRHCLYSGVILLAIAGTLFWLSLSHLIVTLLLFWFFEAKATKEEEWLCQRYPEYSTYQSRVKKLIPNIY